MKKIYTILWMLTISIATMAQSQGWPEKYEGVMLQGFYWDGYDDSKWTVLESQADELSQYFKLIWVPNSGKTSDYYHTGKKTMGYDPCFWLDHTGAFGTETQLRSMINTFKEKGTGIIEDVVINHKNGLNSWCDFPDETKGTYSITWDNTNFSGICKNDECNSKLSEWAKGIYAGKKATGANDTGDNFDGYRDLDHTNATVQQNVKTYLNFLLKDLGYAGFRLDMVKGYYPEYTGIYNKDANPTYSVGEYWDGNVNDVKTWIDGTKQDGKIQSAAFDFPLKYQINSAFGRGFWDALNNTTLTTSSGYARYSVTFVDNHDTDEKSYTASDGVLTNNITAANAFLMAMPGTPCVFLKHWKSYKATIKKLIKARQAAGITSESAILQKTSNYGGFVLKVEGKNGNSVLLLLGVVNGYDTNGYQLAVEGNNFKYYVSNGTDLSTVKAITDTDATSDKIDIPSFCTVENGETCAFFEAPSSWTKTIQCWRWDKQYNYTGNSWPGVACTYLGTANNGKKVWKWTFKSSERVSQPSSNEGIIFNNNASPQTENLGFENGGYYNETGLMSNVLYTYTTAITPLRTTPSVQNAVIYDLQGRKIQGEPTKKGIYIIGGNKVVIK